MPKSKRKACGKRARVSVTDAMKTVQEKLRSAVDRELVRMEDREGMWVCVPGVKGHASYIFKIKDRLKADRFKYARELGWYKSKSVAPERAIGLSDAEEARCALNHARAREIRNMRSAQGGATA
jgi:hypothetical protein